jgi:hypothetical protein
MSPMANTSDGRERAVGFDHDSSGSIGFGTGRRGENFAQRGSLHTCRPDFGLGYDALLTVVIPTVMPSASIRWPSWRTAPRHPSARESAWCSAEGARRRTRTRGPASMSTILACRVSIRR